MEQKQHTPVDLKTLAKMAVKGSLYYAPFTHRDASISFNFIIMFSKKEDLMKTKPYFIMEEISEAGPLAINRLPVFMSATMLNREQSIEWFDHALNFSTLLDEEFISKEIFESWINSIDEFWATEELIDLRVKNGENLEDVIQEYEEKEREKRETNLKEMFEKQGIPEEEQKALLEYSAIKQKTSSVLIKPR